MKKNQLGAKELKKLEETNRARILLGVEPIKVKQRKCLSCPTVFGSLGNRYCNRCGAPKVSTLQNHDII